MALPDTKVMVLNRHTEKVIPVMIKNIVLTNTWGRFTYDYNETLLLLDPEPAVFLRHGVDVGWGGAMESAHLLQIKQR